VGIPHFSSCQGHLDFSGIQEACKSMKNDFRIAINQICNERQLSKEVVIQAIEAALVSAYKKNFDGVQEITVRIDPDTGKARVFAIREIVEEVKDPRADISLADARKIDAMAGLGGKIEQEMTPRDFGRIAAQTAKQVILQRIREAERDALYSQYIDRESEIINGSVRNIDDHGNVVLTLGKAEAYLQTSEQIPGENYRVGQRLRTYVVEVQKTSRGPQILVSRTHRQFLRRLLELEVPEIFSGTVEIKTIAREPGSRSKVAVAAMQEGIDPVGSCVGVRGVRIQNVVNELNGEKIDIVCWNADAGVFVTNALSPAKVAEVRIDELAKTAVVVVPDRQLSLAIGKEGQNARLAAKLTGWRIDIKSTSEAEVEAQRRAEEASVAAALEAEKAAARERARQLLEEAEALIRQEEQKMAAPVESAVAQETAEEVETAVIEEQVAAPTAELEAIEMQPIELAEAAPTELAAPVDVAAPADLAAIEPAAIEAQPATSESATGEATETTTDEVVSEEEVPEGDYDDRKRKSKEQKRQRGRELVFDETSGTVVAHRKHRPSRRRNDWGPDDF
jgi:N utilization substance protein A